MTGFVNTADIIGEQAMEDAVVMRTLTEFRDDRVTKLYTLARAKALSIVDVPNVVYMPGWAFDGCSTLVTVILRGAAIPEIASQTFINTPIASGEGYIYVPAARLEEYKAATNWSSFADQIRAIEDYPEITGGL